MKTGLTLVFYTLYEFGLNRKKKRIVVVRGRIREFFTRYAIRDEKSLCYSKKVEMLKLSVLLLMQHRNGNLCILN
jgi:hypothetical protein